MGRPRPAMPHATARSPSSPRPSSRSSPRGSSQGSSRASSRPGRGAAAADLLVSLAAPLAAVCALAATAAAERSGAAGGGSGIDPAAGLETAYLALAAGIPLLAAGPLAPGIAAAGAVAAVGAAWLLPAGPARGAAVLAVAVLALALAAGARRVRSASLARAAGAARTLDPGAMVALAVGVQALARGDLLLAPGLDGSTLGPLLVAPLAGGFAVLALGRRFGAGPALLAAAAAVVLGPGFTVATLFALLAPVLADLVLGRGVSLLPRLLAAAVLLAPLAAWTRLGLAAAAGGAVAALALAVHGRPEGPAPGAGPVARALSMVASPRVAPGLAVLLGLVTLGLAALRPLGTLGSALASLAPLLLLLPLATPPFGARLVSWSGPALGGLALALATAWAVPGADALAVPAVALVLAATGLDRGASASLAGLRGAWAAAFLVPSLALAAYPWLRPEPLGALLDGLGPGLGFALALLGAGAVLVRSPGRPRGAVSTVVAAGLGVAAVTVAILSVPRPDAVVAGPRVLAPGGPELIVRLPPGTPSRAVVDRLVLDTSLANAAELPPGTPVATVRLLDGERSRAVATLATGGPEGTGEWAARRPSLAAAVVAAAGVAAPAPEAEAAPTGDPVPPRARPWLSWVADGGPDGPFFGSRYRSRLGVAPPAEASAAGPGVADGVVVVVRPDLPEAVRLTVFHLAVFARPGGDFDGDFDGGVDGGEDSDPGETR